MFRLSRCIPASRGFRPELQKTWRPVQNQPPLVADREEHYRDRLAASPAAHPDGAPKLDNLSEAWASHPLGPIPASARRYPQCARGEDWPLGLSGRVPATPHRQAERGPLRPRIRPFRARYSRLGSGSRGEIPSARSRPLPTRRVVSARRRGSTRASCRSPLPNGNLAVTLTAPAQPSTLQHLDRDIGRFRPRGRDPRDRRPVAGRDTARASPPRFDGLVRDSWEGCQESRRPDSRENFLPRHAPSVGRLPRPCQWQNSNGHIRAPRSMQPQLRSITYS